MCVMTFRCAKLKLATILQIAQNNGNKEIDGNGRLHIGIKRRESFGEESEPTWIELEILSAT